MQKLIHAIKNAGILFWIIVLYSILSILYIVGAVVFLNAFNDQSAAPIVIVIIVTISSLSLLAMLSVLYLKLRKLNIFQLKKYLTLKRIHNQAKMGKKVKPSKQIINFDIFIFYFFTLKPVLSVFSLIIILFTAARAAAATPFWIIYLFLIWNTLLIAISLVQVILFSTTRIKADIKHLELLHDIHDDIYPNRAINRKNIESYRDFVTSDWRNSKNYQIEAEKKEQANFAARVAYTKTYDVEPKKNLTDEKNITIVEELGGSTENKFAEQEENHKAY